MVIIYVSIENIFNIIKKTLMFTPKIPVECNFINNFSSTIIFIEISITSLTNVHPRRGVVQ